jgi:two-component system, NtrC family, sensor kinase
MKPPYKLALVVLLSIGFCQKSEGQKRAIDSLKNVLLHQLPDTNKALTYVRLSEKYISTGDTINIFLYADSALALSRKLSFARIEASATENRGYGYMTTGKLDSAKQDFLTSLEIRKKIGQKRGIAQSYFSVGNYYLTLDSLPEALENFYHALEIYEGTGDSTFLGGVRYILSQIYLNQGNDSEAFINARLASEIAKRTGSYTIAVNAMEILGNIQFDQQQYEKALQTFQEAIEMLVQVGLGQTNTGEIYIRIGDTYQKQGEIEFSNGNPGTGLQKYNQALAMYDTTKKIFIGRSYSAPVVALGIYIAKIYIHLKKYQEARKLLEEFLKQPQNTIYETDPGDAYANLASLDSAEGNYKKAFQEYKIYIRNRDSIYKVRNDKRIFSIQMQHEFNVREADAKALQAKKDEEARESKTRQNFAIIALTILILCVLAVALIQMRNNNAKQKANKLLENALINLKSTQAQLIQSEKLASLGELTAGIAHEIQNPLNFMNNFSEVNHELIQEMEQEIDRGNMENLKTITADIRNNEAKISHHGKRADAIVKGMLQHSRSGSGLKQPTDINALADEYLRLSYHGQRAKDNSFNADLQSDYDKSIGKIDIIPQDIGRVLLNLYNNAFYAVAEKAQQKPDDYEPTIRVSTRRINDKVEIKVADNGNGIPPGVMDKIFQPFFTTKPTGQGTGLGLSLSYDIVKAHGGELKVETKEGEGTEFMVQIPLA